MIITKDQLNGLLEYYEMYGVDSMEFDPEKFSETIQNFGVTEIKSEIEIPHGRNLSFLTDKK